MVFPSHLTRLRERVAHELAHNPTVSTVTVLVMVPRAVVDGSTDWVTFARLVDAALLGGWRGSRSTDCASFQRAFTAYTVLTLLNDYSWEVNTLPLKWAAVGLTIGRRSSSSRKVGVYASWAELQAKDRVGISRLVVE